MPVMMIMMMMVVVVVLTIIVIGSFKCKIRSDNFAKHFQKETLLKYDLIRIAAYTIIIHHKTLLKMTGIEFTGSTLNTDKEIELNRLVTAPVTRQINYVI